MHRNVSGLCCVSTHLDLDRSPSPDELSIRTHCDFFACDPKIEVRHTRLWPFPRHRVQTEMDKSAQVFPVGADAWGHESKPRRAPVTALLHPLQWPARSTIRAVEVQTVTAYAFGLNEHQGQSIIGLHVASRTYVHYKHDMHAQASRTFLRDSPSLHKMTPSPGTSLS